MSEVTDDFLEHFGVRGMKWGKRGSKKPQMYNPSQRQSSSGTVGKPSGNGTKEPRQKMSKEKKIAIAVGIGAVAVIGAALVLKSMNKNMDMPMSSLTTNASTIRGQEVFNRPSGLTLTPSSASNRPAGSGLSLSPSRASTSASPRSMPTSPSLNTLASLINGGPQISFNPSTGAYETR